jgi:hypothetical protein
MGEAGQRAGSVESAVGRSLTACKRIGAVACSLKEFPSGAKVANFSIDRVVDETVIRKS